MNDTTLVEPVDPEEGTTEEETVPKGATVSEADYLRLELVKLRRLSASQQATIIQLQLGEAQRRVADRSKDVDDYTKELEEKYGINLTTHDIRSTDGEVVPRAQAGASGIAQLGAMLKGMMGQQ